MANVYNISPIKLDTAFGTQSTSAPVGWKSEVASSLGSPITLIVSKVVWTDPVTVGDTFSIVDPTSGIVLASGACSAAGASVTLDFQTRPRKWTDFMLSQISSGIVYVFTDGV